MKRWMKRLGVFLVPCVILQSLVFSAGITVAAQSPALTPITADGWTATASATYSTCPTTNAYDSDPTTIWSSGGLPSVGAWYQLNMGKQNTFNTIVVDCGNSNDYPGSYNVYISNNGTNYTKVLTGAATQARTTMLRMSTQNAQYIKLEVASVGNGGGWWSIADLHVLNAPAFATANLALNKTGTGYPQGIASFTSSGSKIAYINDGIFNSVPTPINRWSNWASPTRASDWVGADFGTATTVDTIVPYFYADTISCALPTACAVQYWDGSNWVDVSQLTTSNNRIICGENVYRFSAVTTTKIRLNLTAAANKTIGITELEVYGPGVPASFTTTVGAGNTLNAAVQNAVSGHVYQMWVYQKLPADVTGQATDQYIWVPMTPGANNSFSLAGATADANDNYRVSMIETDAYGNVVSKSYDSPASLPTNAARIEKILVGGRVTNGRETVNINDATQNVPNIQIVADNATGYTLTYGTAGSQTSVSPDASGNTFPVSFAGLGVGTYTFTATATNDAGQKDVRTFTVTTYSTAGSGHATPVISGMTGGFTGSTLGLTLTGKDTANNILQIGDGFLYRFRAGEPGRGISYSAASVSGPTGSVPVPVGKYGTYQVYATAAYGSSVAYDDAAMGYYDYTRPGGAVTVSSYTVSENGGAASSATGQTGTTGKNYAFNATADGSKLTGGETARYSFWRCDASGWVLLKDWSPDATLSWTPAYAGKYIIQVRVQGSKAGSYESARNMTFDVSSATGLVTAKNVSLTLTVNGSAARQPVTLTTLTSGQTATDGLLYRYQVQDPTLGLTLLNAYSPDNTFTWVPRKAGNYTVYVQVINQNSFGMYDAQTSKPVAIS